MTTSDAALTPDAPAAPPDPKGRLLLQHRSVGLIALGALAWLAGGALLIADADMLAAGRWYTPTLLAAAHLIGLGFLTTVIVGAVQHLAPNMSSRRLVGGRAVGVTLWGGAVILAVGLATGQAALEGLGGTVLGVGVVWLVVGVALMWRGRRGSWPEPLAGLALSTLWLAGVLVLGLVGIAARHGDGLDLDRGRLIGAHLTMAALGWAGGLIIGVGTRMGPMVLIAPPQRVRIARAALAMWHVGVAVVVIAFAVGVRAVGLAGAVVLAAAIATFAAYLADTVRRRRRQPPVSVLHMLVGAAALVAAAGLTLALPAAEGAPAALLLALVGWAAGATAGHILIMVPTMCWVARYGERRRTGTPRPQVSHLAPTALGIAELAAFVTGVALLVAGMRTGTTALATAGAAALTLSAALVVAGVAIAVWRPYTPPANARTSLPILQGP